VAVGGGANIYAGMPGLPGIELPLICLGELNAPKSCWSVIGVGILDVL